ncbi:MAG: type I 3-dehydroquinate dehydratase [Candidatus Jordarchaeum sp.]|uniref:type I 3-dehydroquinate dehydratase n=1 Tax=Candidatus Jordarchaeum sp. TaxID=2823881 RepID=UPI00404A240A
MALICVPVAVNKPKTLLEKINLAVREAPDIIEVRVDYLEDVDIDFSEIVSKTPIPLILTVRKKGEGGSFKYGEKNRIEMLEKCIEAKPRFVDLELSMNKAVLERLLKLADQNSVSTILSFHSFKYTPKREILVKKIREAAQKGSKLVKIVAFAKKITDNLVALSLPQESKNSGIRVISFCMGELGIISRVFCPFFGSYFTYASLDTRTAPGQINLEVMRKIHKLFYSLMEKKFN